MLGKMSQEGIQSRTKVLNPFVAACFTNVENKDTRSQGKHSSVKRTFVLRGVRTRDLTRRGYL